MDAPDLERAVRRLYGAYAYLREHYQGHVSRTAHLLRTGEVALLAGRLADELDELAGVLLGTHVHSGRRADLILEGSQVCYWTYMLALRQGGTYAALAPALHLGRGATQPGADAVACAAEARALVGACAQWAGPVPLPRLQAVLALVGAACAVEGLPVIDVVRYDLAQMAEQPYLRAYFAACPAEA
jgi:hypothetical protein